MKRSLKTILTIILLLIIVVDIKYLYDSIGHIAKKPDIQNSSLPVEIFNSQTKTLNRETDKKPVVGKPGDTGLTKNATYEPVQEQKTEAREYDGNALPTVPVKREDRVYITTSELLTAKKLNVLDKLKGLMIIRKLSKADRKIIYTLSRGGFTYSEIARLEKVLSESLSEKDLSNLMLLMEKSKRCYARGK